MVTQGRTPDKSACSSCKKSNHRDPENSIERNQPINLFFFFKGIHGQFCMNIWGKHFSENIYKAPNISQNLTNHICPSAAISEAICCHHRPTSPLESCFDFYALSSWGRYTVSEADPIASHKVQTCHLRATHDFQAHREESLSIPAQVTCHFNSPEEFPEALLL